MEQNLSKNYRKNITVKNLPSCSEYRETFNYEIQNTSTLKNPNNKSSFEIPNNRQRNNAAFYFSDSIKTDVETNEDVSNEFQCIENSQENVANETQLLDLYFRQSESVINYFNSNLQLSNVDTSKDDVQNTLQTVSPSKFSEVKIVMDDSSFSSQNDGGETILMEYVDEKPVITADKITVTHIKEEFVSDVPNDEIRQKNHDFENLPDLRDKKIQSRVEKNKSQKQSDLQPLTDKTVLKEEIEIQTETNESLHVNIKKEIDDQNTQATEFPSNDFAAEALEDIKPIINIQTYVTKLEFEDEKEHLSSLDITIDKNKNIELKNKLSNNMSVQALSQLENNKTNVTVHKHQSVDLKNKTINQSVTETELKSLENNEIRPKRTRRGRRGRKNKQLYNNSNIQHVHNNSNIQHVQNNSAKPPNNSINGEYVKKQPNDLRIETVDKANKESDRIPKRKDPLPPENPIKRVKLRPETSNSARRNQTQESREQTLPVGKVAPCLRSPVRAPTDRAVRHRSWEQMWSEMKKLQARLIQAAEDWKRQCDEELAKWDKELDRCNQELSKIRARRNLDSNGCEVTSANSIRRGYKQFDPRHKNRVVVSVASEDWRHRDEKELDRCNQELTEIHSRRYHASEKCDQREPAPTSGRRRRLGWTRKRKNHSITRSRFLTDPRLARRTIEERKKTDSPNVYDSETRDKIYTNPQERQRQIERASLEHIEAKRQTSLRDLKITTNGRQRVIDPYSEEKNINTSNKNSSKSILQIRSLLDIDPWSL